MVFLSTNFQNFVVLNKQLIIIVGPTAVGKTSLAIKLAQQLHAEIISADSRQFYKGLTIGTAAPTRDELKLAKHHFVGHLPVDRAYNVSHFEQDVIHFLNSYFQSSDSAIMVGGSGLYIDAVCHGIDELPDADENLRKHLKMRLEKEGLDNLVDELRLLDPAYVEIVDKNNPNRILRALEVCMATGKTFSSLRNRPSKQRNFQITKIGLGMPRPQLVERIHKRVDQMIATGLIEEVRSFLPLRDLNALNTVGYKEIFKYLDGEWTLDFAIEKIKTHTRRYAKRQMTWFRKDKDITWFHPEEMESIIRFVQ